MSRISFETIKSVDALAAYGATLITAIVMYAMSQGAEGVGLAAAAGIVGGLCGFYSRKPSPTT